MREVDIKGEYSNSFAAILPSTESRESLQVAEKIRSAVEEAEFEGGEVEPQVKMHISIGIVQFPNDAFDEKGLLSAAQMALAKARERGGNQVAFYAPSVKEISQ